MHNNFSETLKSMIFVLQYSQGVYKGRFRETEIVINQDECGHSIDCSDMKQRMSISLLCFDIDKHHLLHQRRLVEVSPLLHAEFSLTYYPCIWIYIN